MPRVACKLRLDISPLKFTEVEFLNMNEKSVWFEQFRRTRGLSPSIDSLRRPSQSTVVIPTSPRPSSSGESRQNGQSELCDYYPQMVAYEHAPFNAIFLDNSFSMFEWPRGTNEWG